MKNTDMYISIEWKKKFFYSKPKYDISKWQKELWTIKFSIPNKYIITRILS